MKKKNQSKISVLYKTVVLLLFTITMSFSQATQVADSLYASGSYTKAINAYAEAGTPVANLQIARAYNAMGNYDKAITQYESLIAEHNELQLAQFELGKLYLKTKSFDAARKIFTSVVSKNPANPEYHYYHGEAFRNLEQFSSSLVAYKKAIHQDSTHLRSLFQMGKFFVLTQENLQALPYLNKGLEFYPNDISLLNLKALAHYNNNDYESAIPIFEKLFELGETKEHMYLKLADSYAKEWVFDKAKQTYQSLLQNDEENHQAYFGLAGVYYKMKQLDSAAIHYKKSISVQDPILHREYLALAEIARAQNDMKAALDYYKLAYEENTDSMRAYYNICTTADQYYKDPKIRLEYYENFQKRFTKKHRYYSATVTKRIRELKEEIHFAQD